MSAPVLQLATLDPPQAADVKLIVNGRYQIPDPVTGKSKLWTRATTFAKTIADEFHLQRWNQRMLAIGLVLRQDLYAAVAAAMPADVGDQTKEERERLNGLCRDAMNAAGSAKGSNLGSALHTFTDAVDSGRQIIIPAPWDRDVSAYRTAMDAHEIGVDPRFVEQIITVPSLGVAGKFDRILTWQGRRPIGDLKTAKSLDLGWGEIAIQLALYAHAETIYTPGPEGAPGVHQPMPKVDQERALVMHLPVGQGECFLYEVDIAAGWEAAQLVLGVRGWRRRRDLAQQINAITRAPEPPPAPVAETAAPARGEPTQIGAPLDRVVASLAPAPDAFAGLPDDDGNPRPDRAVKWEWLKGRRDTLCTVPDGRERLAARWPAGVPTFTQSSDHTLDQLEVIRQVLTTVEAEVRAPFAEPDPTDPANVVVANDDPRLLELVRRGMALPPDLEQSVFAAARHEKVPRLSTGRITQAHLAIVRRLITQAENEARPRRERISNAVTVTGERGVTPKSLCEVLGAADLDHLHGPALQLLDDLADAVLSGLLAERDGALIVDRPADLLAAYGDDRGRLWRAGQHAAKANGWEIPKDSDAVLAHPLLAAVLAAV